MNRKHFQVVPFKRNLPVALVMILGLCSLPLFVCGSVRADTSPIANHQIGLAVGAVHNQVREELLAPLSWGGPGLVIDLWYVFENNTGSHQLELSAPFSFPTNRYDHQSWTWELYAGYSYVHKVAQSKKGGTVWVGALIDWRATGQEYYSWDVSHIYWLNAYELGPTAKWRLGFGKKHALAARLDFPVIALVSRPPLHRYNDEESDGYWFAHMNDNLTFTSLHEYISVTARLDYDWRVHTHVIVGVAYRFHFATFSEPERFSTLSHNILMKVAFPFKQPKATKR
jgi:hypothetical protein